MNPFGELPHFLIEIICKISILLTHIPYKWKAKISVKSYQNSCNYVQFSFLSPIYVSSTIILSFDIRLKQDH